MIKAIIVEDEEPLRNLLKVLIREVDEEINILATTDNINDALEAVENLHPDLIFLDIILPGGTGFDLLEKLSPGSAEVIFITAHDSFALEAFRHSVIGYVLKPVDKDQLKLAISNAKKRIQNDGKTDFLKLFEQLKNHEAGNQKIAIPTSEGFLFVRPAEIIRCESDKVYTWIFLESGKKVLCSYNIGEFKKNLPEQLFFQVHKSHIISLQQVKSYNGKENTIEMVDGIVIPVSRRNKQSFLNNFRLISRNLD